MSGLFITFEGGEGTGKSTQIRRLADALRALNHQVVLTREPGGTKEGEVIRELLVSGDTERWSRNSEMLLNFAAREIHLKQLIRPSLAQGKIVICDRFIDSTAVYQCFAGGGDFGLFQKLRELIVGPTMPDFTFVLDVDPNIGIQRSRGRMANLKMTSEQLAERGLKDQDYEIIDAALKVENMANEDRYERMAFDFHVAVRNGFQQIAKSDPERCTLIDTSTGIESVTINILAELDARVRA
jgi:dTMP kinase